MCGADVQQPTCSVRCAWRTREPKATQTAAAAHQVADVVDDAEVVGRQVRERDGAVGAVAQVAEDAHAQGRHRAHRRQGREAQQAGPVFLGARV